MANWSGGSLLIVTDTERDWTLEDATDQSSYCFQNYYSSYMRLDADAFFIKKATN